MQKAAMVGELERRKEEMEGGDKEAKELERDRGEGMMKGERKGWEREMEKVTDGKVEKKVREGEGGGVREGREGDEGEEKGYIIYWCRRTGQ